MLALRAGQRLLMRRATNSSFRYTISIARSRISDGAARFADTSLPHRWLFAGGVVFGFGSRSPLSIWLLYSAAQAVGLRLRRWIELARQIGGRRLLIDGSFVTAKEEPNDIDAVILLPSDFQEQVAQGIEAALELEEMLLTRRPEEIFAAEDEVDWNEWIEFFSRTREDDDRRKGLVEVTL
ncbi:MAG TPA: hypothetical protein VN688_19540 [Gemmataceae bacterium]|nr:hypothetical protein [Gemmataceae bacterium]